MITDIGIDLGTSKTVIVRSKSIVLNEPSVVLIDAYSSEPVKFGREAFQALGRSPDRLQPVCPIERGVIADYHVAEEMMRHFLHQATNGKMVKPRVMVSMPSGVTAVQQRSIMDAVQSAGARNVCLIEAPMAAAIGLGVDFSKPHGTIIVDIGAGTTDVAVMSLGGLAKCESARVAGADIDEAIIRYMKREHNLLIGVHMADKLKRQLGAGIRRPVEIAMLAKGLSLQSGLPEAVEVTADEIFDAISEVIDQICSAVQSVLNKTPPELVGDIAADGIYLTGGMSLMYGMDQMLARYTGAKVICVSDPLTCVARGTGIALKHPELLQNGDYEFRTMEDLITE